MTKGTSWNDVLRVHHADSNHHSNIGAEHNLSVAPAIEQAISDARHALDPSLVSAVLPHGAFNQGASLLAGRAPDAGSGDPSKGAGSSTTTFNSPADALRNSTRFDPAHNPTSDRGDLKDDGVRPDKASFGDLAAQLATPSPIPPMDRRPIRTPGTIRRTPVVRLTAIRATIRMSAIFSWGVCSKKRSLGSVKTKKGTTGKPMRPLT